MFVPRTLLRSSQAASRRFTTRATRHTCLCLSSRLSMPSRKLATFSRLFQEKVDTPSRGQEVPLTSFTPRPSGSHARSIAIVNLNKRAPPSEIKSFLESKGLVITKWQLCLDRFTFQNDGRCFAELASEDQAQKAIESLNGTEFMHSSILVRPVKEDFVWGSAREPLASKRYFNIEETSPSEVLKPLLEGRRLMFSVQPPGWGPIRSGVGHNEISRHHIEQHLGTFGIESLSRMAPFYGDMKQNPRMLCFIDFTTKDGADQAMQAVHGKEIEGRKVWLQMSKLAPWRADQVGKVDKAVLSELQEKGMASTEPYEDNFVHSDRTKGAKYHNMTQTQRIEAIKTEEKKGKKRTMKEQTNKEAKLAS